jgi:Lambda phage tail tape-measure protein (Tape_meas_lam_C)
MPNQAKVAEVYAELVLSTAKFKAAMQDATAETKKFSAQMRAQMRDAQGSVRIVSEELGIRLPRALQGFVARLPGVATAMSAAFNAVAVLALVGIVVQAGQRIAEFVEKTQEAGRKNAEAWRGVQQPLRAANDALQLTNDKLANSIAKLSHKPQNGLKEAIDEAIVSAGILGDKLTEDAAKIADTLKAQQIGVIGRIAGNATTTDVTTHARDLQTNLEGIQLSSQTFDTKGLDKAAIDAKRKQFADQYQAALDAEIKWATTQLADAKKAQAKEDSANDLAHSGTGLGDAALATGATGADQNKRLGLLTDYSTGLGQMSRFNGLSETNSVLSGKNDVLKAQQDNIEAAKKASAELLQTYETAFSKQKAEYGMSLLAESAFWRSRLKNFNTASKEYGEVYAKANEPINKLLAGTAQAYRDRTGPAPSLTPNRSEDADTSAIARGLEQQAALNAAITEAATKYKLETGAISEHDAALVMAGVHTDEYKAKLATLTAELAKLHSEEMDVNGQNVDPENAAKQQGVQNQIAELNGKRGIQVLTDTQATLSTTWQGMIDSVFDELVRKSKDTTDQIKQIASSLIDGINGNLAKALTGQKTNFRGTLRSTGESLTKTGLGKLEGMGLSALGFGGGKRDGSSAGSAFFVQMATGGGVPGAAGIASLFGGSKPNVTGPGGMSAGGVTGAATHGLVGFLNNNNWASSLFGGKLFGSGSIFGGGMALGGYTSTGGVFDVGEFGRERISLPAGAHVTPNKDMASGGPVQHIDARGTDPVMVHDAVTRANRATYQRSVHDASRATVERSRRTPK